MRSTLSSGIKLLFLCTFIFNLNANERPPREYELPLEKIPQQLKISDDLNFEGLELAIQRQLESFERFPLEGNFIIEGQKYPKTILKDSLLKLRSIITSHRECRTQLSHSLCQKQAQDQFKKEFLFFQPAYSETEEDKALFTAYYSPVIKGHKTKSAKYPHPVYARPQDDRLRLESTRVGIDLDGVLEGHGLELFYADNLFELYMLHIEGGGKIEIEETGESYYLSFDGTNKQRWSFLSSYMMEQGYINSHDMEDQKQFLDAHPEKWREVYSICPSYVYFKVTETPPEGLDGIPLTDHRSMAQDRNIYPQKGLIGFVESERPIRNDDGSISYVPFKRLYIDQDTGGAIKGKARADLYFGEDEKARTAGLNLKRKGDITFLLSLPQL